MYVNIFMPYYFFIMNDPDGNKIQITGMLWRLKHTKV